MIRANEYKIDSSSLNLQKVVNTITNIMPSVVTTNAVIAGL